MPLANVIYQSTQYIPTQFEPAKATPITSPEPVKPSLADVGVGTEGFVKILDMPTKKEQLAEMIQPVKPKVLDLEQMERKQMGQEDNASVMLGLSKFNVQPKPAINANLEPPPLPEMNKPMGVPTFNFEEYQAVEKPMKKTEPSGYASGYGSEFEKTKDKPISASWDRSTEQLNELMGSNLTPQQAKYAYKNLKAIRGIIAIEKKRMKGEK
jgi:hypothetical protein